MATNVYQGVAGRKHITLKTKLAAALLHAYPHLYSDAKLMTEDQLLSLFQWDHNMLYESRHVDRDAFWNLTPLLIKAHREKTRQDATVIAKGRRIRIKHSAVRTPKLRIGPGEALECLPMASLQAPRRPARTSRKLRSRGFDKTRRRKMDGTVVKR